MTTQAPTDCRTCRAGRLQAENAAIAYFCPDHGRFVYGPAARIRELEAGLAACRAVLETCDWTGPYADLNAARRACGLPEL